MTFNETWHIINQEKDSWTQAKELNIIEGETVQIPVNFDNSKPFSKAEASLVLNRNNTIIQNMFKRINLIQDPSKHYHILQLEDLEVGEYTLKTKFCSNEFQTIKIIVHKGQQWRDNFILKKNQMFQTTA